MVRFALMFALACDGAAIPDAGMDAGPRACRSPAQCGDQRCVVDGIPEIALEDGEEGICADVAPPPPSWTLRPGGAIADRICAAGGLTPGASDAVIARQIELLTAAQVRLVRLDFRWAHLEPEAGTFTFAGHDAIVDAAIAAGIDVIAILAYGVPWAAEGATDEFYPPDDPADFERYVRAVVEHFDGRVARYEIWNEPNGGYRFWKPTVHGEAARFAELQARAASAIRELCSACTIYSAGLFFHEQVINGAVEFTRDMLDADPDALRDVDAFAFHPYPQYPPADAPELDGPAMRSFSGMDDDLRALVDLPIAVTELGWPIYGTVDEATQAIFLSRAFLIGAALGWDPICWFNVTDGPRHGMFPPEDDFGLYRFGSEDPAMPIDPKPARDALAWVATLGAFTGPHELHDPAQGVFALDFGNVTAIWSLEGQTVHIHDSAQLFDHLGQLGGVTPGEVEIGPAPIFVDR